MDDLPRESMDRREGGVNDLPRESLLGAYVSRGPRETQLIGREPKEGVRQIARGPKEGVRLIV